MLKKLFFYKYLLNAYNLLGCVPEYSYEVLMSKPVILLLCGRHSPDHVGLPPSGEASSSSSTPSSQCHL